MIVKQLHEMSGGGYSGHSIMDSMLVRTAATANEVIAAVMEEEEKLLLALVETYQQRAVEPEVFGDPDFFDSPLMLATERSLLGEAASDILREYAKEHVVSVSDAVAHLAYVQLSSAKGVGAAVSVAATYRHSIEAAMVAKDHAKFDQLWFEVADLTMRIPPCQPMPPPVATVDTNLINDLGIAK